MEGEMLGKALKNISSINNWLGGNKATIIAINELLSEEENVNRPWKIIDIGCGSGDTCRLLSNHYKKRNIACEIVGIDANAYTIQYAQDHSKDYDNINYRVMNIQSKELDSLEYDIAVSTLTLHHFNDTELENLLQRLVLNAKKGIVINDLHRNRWAYYLFKVLGVITGMHPMNKEDGLISILRGFKRNEIELYSRKLNISNYNIQWRWAFRYIWTMNTT